MSENTKNQKIPQLFMNLSTLNQFDLQNEVNRHILTIIFLQGKMSGKWNSILLSNCLSDNFWFLSQQKTYWLWLLIMKSCQNNGLSGNYHPHWPNNHKKLNFSGHIFSFKESWSLWGICHWIYDCCYLIVLPLKLI